ncbi:hypothetical protein C3941_19650 [Kaistia algarum]|uniref:hypothetical protein n=1 Tax=Kaistia algarum TaxID=2083279 RepID=UPI000CE90964|nr:hypothetical protein [Kaistia algarum]MCX5516206.1 hypothetical protein [Kaistia algarum]PPE78281.1 hypothetical protein C3941_19650 [Kaistia algarum]
MADRSILCLDLATVVGVAEGPVGELPRSTVWRLAEAPGTSHGERYAVLFRHLWERTEAFKPAAIYYEAPLPPTHMRGQSNIDTASFLMGLPAIVKLVGQLRGIWRVEPCNVQDVRGHFIGGRQFLFQGKPVVGRRNLDSKAAKFCTVARARELGASPATHDEADAIALHSYASALIRPETGTASTPLFAGAA